MSMNISETEVAEITKIICPGCGNKLRGIGLMKDSVISGLSFRCRYCQKLFRVDASPEPEKPNTEKRAGT